MNIRQVIDTCSIGTVLYRYTLGLSKFKLLAVYKPNHQAFMLDTENKSAWTEYDYQDGYFKTEKEAMIWRISCINKQIDDLTKEREILNRKIK